MYRSVWHSDLAECGACAAGVLLLLHGRRSNCYKLWCELRALPAHTRLRRSLSHSQLSLPWEVQLWRSWRGAAGSVWQSECPSGHCRCQQTVDLRPDFLPPGVRLYCRCGIYIRAWELWEQRGRYSTIYCTLCTTYTHIAWYFHTYICILQIISLPQSVATYPILVHRRAVACMCRSTAAIRTLKRSATPTHCTQASTSGRRTTTS